MSIAEIRSLEGLEDFIGKLSCPDPHFSREPGNLYEALHRKGHRVFAVRSDGEISGVFVWLAILEEGYVELIVGLSDNAAAWSEMLSHMDDQYPGCQMDIVIAPNNTAAREALAMRRAAFDPEQRWMRWTRQMPRDPECRIELYASQWRESYRALHRRDTYWTADRVLAAPERFRVLLALHGNQLIGYIDVTHCFEENEPYDLFVAPEYARAGYEQALLAEAARLNAPKRLSAQVDIDEVELYSAAGFEAAEGCDSVCATYRSPEEKTR